MKSFEIANGQVAVGIPCDMQGAVLVGEAGRGRKLVTVPPPAGAVIEGRREVGLCPSAGTPTANLAGQGCDYCPDCQGRDDSGGHRPLPGKPGRIVSLPDRAGEENAAVVPHEDHSGFRSVPPGVAPGRPDCRPGHTFRRDDDDGKLRHPDCRLAG